MAVEAAIVEDASDSSSFPGDGELLIRVTVMDKRYQAGIARWLTAHFHTRGLNTRYFYQDERLMCRHLRPSSCFGTSGGLKAASSL